MDELRNLEQIYSLATDRFNHYDGKDFVLPKVFKEQVTEINSNTITYNKYSAVIETRGNQNGGLNIFLPNQWFYIASYFTELYNELQRYKKEALKVVSKERLKILNGSTLTGREESLLLQLSLSDQSKKYLRKFITDYSWWNGAKTIDRGDFYVSPILNSARLVNASQSFVAELCAFLADKKDLVQAIISGEESTSEERTISNATFPLQQIYYGAPGTGKSFEIKKQTTGKQVIRTTFHPDSDYSTFVGAYKPTTIEVPMRDVTGKVIVEDGEPVTENRIIYEFVQQAFLQAYTKAWKKYASATNEGKKPEEVYLVIEEINRGNCAQIFGDLFQLLDRGDNGFSEYPINADKDMRKQLAKAFTDMAFLNAPAISGMSSEQVALKIRNGEILLLPNNLYIWATMNTSDQSLFPIDSAFKRRWDWKYVPIADGKEGWQVEVNGKRYDWWEFLQKINDKIGYATNSEDKKLGYYFCKATNGVINAETFVGKVIFYIWNDVFKDFAEEAGDLFKDENDSLLSFNKFYIVGEDGKTKVVETKVEQFLKNLGIEFQLESFAEEVVEDDDGNDGFSNGRDYSKFSVNGVGRYPKNNLAAECMKQYIQLNPQMPIETVLAKWRALGDIVPHFVESKEEYDARTDNSKRSHELQCGDSVIYVAHNGYGSNGKVFTLIDAVNKQNWGLRLAKVEE